METIAALKARLIARREIDENGCWNWMLGCNEHGYGMTSNTRFGRHRRVHRLAAQLWLDFPLRSSLCVLHRCDNPRCFNPEHLFIGTIADNQADMKRKGRARGPEGAANPNVKLTPDDIRAIRRLRETGMPQTHIARQFGVSSNNISLIDRRKIWGHVD